MRVIIMRREFERTPFDKSSISSSLSFSLSLFEAIRRAGNGIFKRDMIDYTEAMKRSIRRSSDRARCTRGNRRDDRD